MIRLKKKTFELKPISKDEFEKLSKRVTYYDKIVRQFMKGKDDIIEVCVEGAKINTVYTGLKKYAQRKNYPFLLRRREGRLFLLKVKKQENP